ncbi:MAG: Lin1244/Lin1753 domain-containing protein [Smithella sp.]
MGNDTFYFKHDCKARVDRKLINLAMVHGMAGLGIYWCVVEMLYEENGYLPLEYERIAFELRTDTNVIRSVINDFDLFKIDVNKFYSESALNQLKLRAEKSEKAILSVSKRWEYERNTNVIRAKTKRNTSIVEYSKEEKNNKPTEISFPEWLPVKTFNEYLLCRKKKLKKEAYNRFFNKLKKLSDSTGNTPEEILDQSISNGWEGIFEVKETFNGLPKKEAWEK